MPCTHRRRDLQPHLVAEPIDPHNLVNALPLLPTDSDLITRDDIPILDTVLPLCRLDDGVSEHHPPFPMTVVREEMTETLRVRAAGPSLDHLVFPQHFRDRHCRVAAV